MIPIQRSCVLLTTVATLLCQPLIAQSPHSAPSASMDALRQSFLHPPAEARPMVRWWWFGAAVEKPEILLELQQMKADGIGGAELAFVYPEVVDDPAHDLKNLPFLSPAMLDAITYAQAEGRKLGLRIDITLCSGWPYGGPAITLADAATRLRTVEVAVPPNATSAALPALKPGESFISAALVEGNVSPEPVRGSNESIRRAWNPATTHSIATDGKPFGPAPTARVALFFIQSHTGQQVKRAAVNAEGFVLDPFSRQAVATHLQAVGEPLVKAFGATPPYAIFSDSLEAYGADWTPDLPAEFKQRRGYDLLPHLAELVAGGSPEAEQIRHDYGQTLTDLVNQNYLVQINDWAKAHGTKFRSQTYGEPAVTFSSQNLVALAEGEGPQWRAFSTLRWATSANHVFGHNVTSGETFTWLHSPVFRATPLDMKAEADIDFIMGENQLVFHGWPYSPPAGKVPEPGWSLYAAGSFNDHNPWHPVMPAVTSYITRLSFLMRQGEPANQVAVLLPVDDAWASFTPSHVTVTGAMQTLISPALMSAILSSGYNVDYIDADAINRIGLGTHEILVIPPTDRIPVETLKRISTWAKKPGQIICVERCPSIDPSGKPLPGAPVPFKLVHSAAELPQALTGVVQPDFTLVGGDNAAHSQLGFIRRVLPDADIYFVANTSNQPINTTASFATSHKSGEAWDPDTASVSAASATGQSIHLKPYESRVFVFGAASAVTKPAVASTHQLADLSSEWRVNFLGVNKTLTESNLTDWTADPATAHYSGEAVYSRDFTLASPDNSPGKSHPVYLQIEGGSALPGAPDSHPERPVLAANGLPDLAVTRTGPGMHAFFDPPIHEAALVTINGKSAGALWHPPYRLDITHLLKPGQNHIEIHVFNTALNAWSALPPHDYKPLIQQYGDRFQMQDLDQVKPIASGILGPIHLVTQESP